jgi:hypothetical protein
MNNYIIKFDIERSVFEDSIDPRYYIDNLKEIGKVQLDIVKENIPDIGDDITDDHGFIATVTLQSDAPFDLLKDIFNPLLDRGVSIELQEEKEEDKTWSIKLITLPPHLNKYLLQNLEKN